jgi:hypothetical protein
MLFEVCPLTMRTQGILLVRDVILLLAFSPPTVSALHPHHKPVVVDIPLGPKLESWRRSCGRTLALLEELSQNLLRKINGFHKHANTIGADVVGSSCIACLAHLAILYEVVSRMDPASRSETHKLCDSALQNLGALTSELSFDEHSYLDLLLGVRPLSFYLHDGDYSNGRPGIGLLEEIFTGL